MSGTIRKVGAVGVLALVLGAGAYFVSNGSLSSVAAGTDATVLAKVNDQKITRADVKKALEGAPEAQQANIEQLYPMLIDQMVNDALLTERVDSAGINSDPEVKKRVDEAREQIVRGLYVERYVESKVTDEAVKAEYAEIEKRNKGIKEARARHILVETEDEAKAIIAEAKSGKDFTALAKEKSTGPSGPNGGDLGYFTREAMVKEFSDAAFAMAPGEVTSAPVKTQFGWHVIKLEDLRERPVPKLTEVEQVIRTQLGQKAIEDLVKEMREGAQIEIFDFNGKPMKDEG